MKKGFTLIELLAVIVILSVIALISTPMILGVIESSKENSSKVSAYGYIDAVEKTIATNMLDSNKTNILDGVYEVSTLNGTAYNVKVKGDHPTDDSWVKIEKGQVVEYSLKIREYVINYNASGTTITKGGEITTKPDGGVKSGPIKEEASSEDTHKGIVYLDPTDLSKTCTKEMAESNLNENGLPTKVKAGCMKWYIYDDSGDNYTMILDHNTATAISQNNVLQEVQKLQTESEWVANPRMISAEEVNTITGKTDFNVSSTSSGYCFDDCKVTSKGTNKYAWLFDYTDCEGGGCNVADSSTFGYWTSTIVDSDDNVWLVSSNSLYPSMGLLAHGIRPVITIPKSIIK